jgi:hypothetical protein
MPTPNLPARRTQHPYRVERPADLSAELRQLAEQSLLPDDPIHTIFVIPAQLLPVRFGGQGGEMHTVPEQALLFTAHGVLHVQGENPPEQPSQTTYLQGDRLLYAHLSMILTYEKLELCGIANSALARIVIEYCAVGHALLQPALLRLLRLAWGNFSPDNPGVYSTGFLLYHLEQESFKFNSGLSVYVLQPGEQLLGYVFQPPIMKRYLGVIRRPVASPVLLALTESELVIIEEGITNTTRYGMFITYCPRICVSGVEIKADAAWQDVCVHLSRGDFSAERWTKLESKAAQAWQDLCSSQNIGTHITPGAWALSETQESLK